MGRASQLSGFTEDLSAVTDLLWILKRDGFCDGFFALCFPKENDGFCGGFWDLLILAKDGKGLGAKVHSKIHDQNPHRAPGETCCLGCIFRLGQKSFRNPCP